MLENTFNTLGALAAMRDVQNAASELTRVRQALSLGADGIERLKRSNNSARPLYSNPTLNAAIWLSDSAPKAIRRLRDRECELIEIVNDGRTLIEGVKSALGDKYACILTLCYVRGLQYKEVESILGFSCATIKRYKAIAINYMDSVGYYRACKGVSISDI